MSRNLIAGIAVALVIALGLAIWLLRPRNASTAAVVVDATGQVIAPGEGVPVRLFFGSADGLLHLESRTLTLPTDDERTALAATDGRQWVAELVVEALLGEPETDGLRRVFEEGTELADVRIGSDGVAIVSLQPAAGSVNRGLGSRAELLRVYGLVNSLAYSVEGVVSVAIVWAGSQPLTLAGHVDTSRPLLPSLDWVANGSRQSLAGLAESQADGPASGSSSDESVS